MKLTPSYHFNSWLVVSKCFKHDWMMFHFIYGMSSFPTDEVIVFKMVIAPPTSIIYNMLYNPIIKPSYNLFIIGIITTSII